MHPPQLTQNEVQGWGCNCQLLIPSRLQTDRHSRVISKASYSLQHCACSRWGYKKEEAWPEKLDND